MVDATFRYAADRQAFAAAAGAAAEGAVWIECRAPAAVIARRAAARSSQPDRVSDADAAIAARQLTEWAPLTEIPATNRVTVATDRSPEASVLAARDALDERMASAEPRSSNSAAQRLNRAPASRGGRHQRAGRIQGLVVEEQRPAGDHDLRSGHEVERRRAARHSCRRCSVSGA